MGFFLMVVSSHGKHRNHTETRKIKKAKRGDDVYRPPSPHTEPTEINGIHEKGAGAGCSEGAASAEQVFEGNLRLSKVDAESGRP
ncbi:MAG: hypothetical protein WC180_07400 [Candidatus Paceibacterota bacterium]